MNTTIEQLVRYAIDKELISSTDKIYITNTLLELFHIDDYVESGTELEECSLEEILGRLLDCAYEKGLIPDNSIGQRDLFDTKIMGILTPRPSQVMERFEKAYKESPKKATEYYYQFSMDTDYIRRYRIEKDMAWVTTTEYGDIDITINLSKPEKDPKAIAAAKNAKQSGYPRCLLCKENEGFAGHLNHPARQNHRIIPITIDNQAWGLQYSPYVYYNEHCIVFHGEHVPMKIDQSTFAKLFDFVKMFPHYFIGSNADLPIVGGSILTHEHYQGGNYEFAMAKAPIEEMISVNGYEDVSVGIVKWPMSVIRISGLDSSRLVELGGHILDKWRNYSDESLYIYSETNGEPHNTITPIARKVGDNYELDLVLRNNITTEEHPLGVYHPHAELHNIKKENIGLIEVMGLAVLPSRLKEEMEILADYILQDKEIESCDAIAKHAQWVKEFLPKYPDRNKDNIQDIFQKEIGITFSTVLEHAGVFKRDDEGRAGFKRFIDSL